jgi:6-phosphogluconate dehydrogenase
MRSQRDYFGAHTFRVLPGKENDKLKAGQDIRKRHFLSTYCQIGSFSSDVNWTGRGGNVSASSYNT